MRVSVIIPVLNEENSILRLLRWLRSLPMKSLCIGGVSSVDPVNRRAGDRFRAAVPGR
jgi:hypothetical protein